MAERKSSAQIIDLKALIAEDQELMREVVRQTVQQVLEAEMTAFLGAGPGERTEGRQGYRGGARRDPGAGRPSSSRPAAGTTTTR